MTLSTMARATPEQSTDVAIWGGVECTVNRVGDVYHDQLERNGHATRLDDLRAFAELGIRTLRFPLLWERTAPDGIESATWDWADARMELMRELGIRPIVGLVHHGSGPLTTDLLDPAFPEKLAEYARAVAERYPWVELYTPVNEPLTTARFSALYGLWYPHARDDRSFVQALLNECRATSMAMSAIREVNPSALLVQTEDLGRTHSTQTLDEQARFENHRRWLTFDLLSGAVNDRHPLWEYLTHNLESADALQWMREHPMRPDIMGLNYYLTSERYLDERVERYPGCDVGGNGRHRYVDIEAIRVLPEGIDGPDLLIREAWDRYGISIAVTETHLGCARVEQIRWFMEMVDAADRLRRGGVELLAVTAWALLGTYDWHCLVTRCDGVYEPGVFDVRSGTPRPTALAAMIRSVIAGDRFEHPLLDGPGWWRRPDRIIHPPSVVGDKRLREHTVRDEHNTRPLLIAGATGTLGRAFARQCRTRGVRCRLVTRREMDIADRSSVERILDEVMPWAVVNAAGYVRVDAAERNRELCMRENADGAATIAQACAARGIRLATFSSDLVFDGATAEAYTERSETSPLSVYGRSKADAEYRVLEAHSDALVVRTSAFFGPWDEHNFITLTLRSLAIGERVVASSDMTVSPTYVPDLADETLNLMVDGESGIWHLANDGATTWADLARIVATRAGHDPSLVIGRPTGELGLLARRPRYSVLSSVRGGMLPTLERALGQYFNDRREHIAVGLDATAHVAPARS